MKKSFKKETGSRYYVQSSPLAFKPAWRQVEEMFIKICLEPFKLFC